MKINDDLFQDMCTNHAEAFHFPPLTAHIFTYLMFDFDREGFSFEEIQETMSASKSSVSNALNRLLQTGHIEFITKIGDRKRYYRINKEIFMLQFNEELNQYKKTKNLIDRYAEFRRNNFRSDINTQKIKLHQQLINDKINLQEKMITALSELNQKHIDNK